MNQDKLGKLTFAILDYNRPKEASLCLASIKRWCSFPHQILYVSNGGDQGYVHGFYLNGMIDTLVLNKSNVGCGIATKLAIQAAMTEWVVYCQCDQYMNRPFNEDEFTLLTDYLLGHTNTFYVDLAGDQGHGSYSERAGLVNRARYLAIPGLDRIVGGPGPYANYTWTEEHLQRHVQDRGFSIISANPVLFANNGKWSQRSYPCGGETKHSTDERKLFILKPLLRRYDDFPNLKLTDAEWDEVLSGRWPVEGKIPELDRQHSFVYWPE